MKLKIQIIYKSKYFEAYSIALNQAINEFGFSSSINNKLELKNEELDAVIYVGMHEFYNEHIVSGHHAIVCGIQTEQFPTFNSGGLNYGYQRLKIFKKNFHKFDFIFDWNQEIVDSYKSNKLVFFPHGYHPEFARSTLDKNKKYDIIFIGDPTGIRNRRAHILNDLREKYLFHPKHNNLWGVEKDLALSESKIILNLHFEDSFTFESPRFYEALSGGHFFLSEKSVNSFPFEENVDFASFYLHTIHEKISYYLNNYDEAVKIAENGHRKCKSFSINKNISLVLEKILLEKYNRKYGSYRLHKKLQKFGLKYFKLLDF